MRMCEPLLAGISGNELRHQQYSLASLIRAEKDQFAHGKLANLTINKLEISEVVRQASLVMSSLREVGLNVQIILQRVALKSAIRNGLQYGECIQRLRTALSLNWQRWLLRVSEQHVPEIRNIEQL
ncbi:hypothetical protein GJ496_003056 [Pomphorhynchus laevis]|nr:hypothetical protein GJ496_003056 [Pomphorhynchus laevis]